MSKPDCCWTEAFPIDLIRGAEADCSLQDVLFSVVSLRQVEMVLQQHHGGGPRMAVVFLVW
nr:unnamed protein product [Digitaria exilis]